MNDSTTKLAFGSICAKEIKPELTTAPHILPIYATSSFAFESIDEGIDIFKGSKKGHVYGRYGNPTMEAVARKVARLETHGLDMNAKAIFFSSGMAAIHTLLISVLKAGDTILTQGNLYGGTTELFTKVLSPLGIQVRFVNLNDLQRVEETVKQDASIRLIYFETPSNPTLDCVDMESINAICKKYDLLSVADNTFCTPYLQQPFQYGTDYIVHSTTKFLNGHGNSISGILVGKDVEAMESLIWRNMKLTGTNGNPFDAWLTHNGLKTLHLRMDKHSSNALSIAQYLESHPKVSRVNYNGLTSHPHHEIAAKQMNQFGAMLSFELKGGLEAGISFMRNIQHCTLAPTLGDVDTLVLHPASMSHVNIDKEMRLKNGITDGLIRLSVGIEEVEDLVADLDQAMDPQ